MAHNRPIWTFILIGICAVVFVLEFYLPLIDYFSFVPADALTRPWIFVTSIFLHANTETVNGVETVYLSHIFFNMFALFVFGIYLEPRIGSKNFLLIFFLSGIIGNIGYMATAPGSDIPGIGASGAIYGVMGTLAVIAPFLIVYVAGLLPMPMIAAAGFWTLMEFFGLFYPSDVAHGAHLFGLFFGITIGLYMRARSQNVSRVNYF